MKHLSAILFINLIVVCEVSYTQIYIPFPEDSAQWCMNYSTGHPDDPIHFNYIYEYAILNDTVINGLNYKNIGATRKYAHQFGYLDGEEINISNGEDVFAGLAGALREEDRRIYFYKYTYEGLYKMPSGFSIGDTNEVLLYDFNLAVGDSIALELGGEIYLPSNKFYVSQIDSILLEDGIYHKQYWLINDYGVWQSWIEGVGERDNGLLGSYVAEFEHYFWDLNALIVNDDVVYSHDFDGDCDIFVSLDDPNKELVKCYPVPFNESLVINIGSSFENLELRLYNLFGKKVYNSSIKNFKEILDTENLIDGVYLLVMYQDSSKVYSQKIIKKSE